MCDGQLYPGFKILLVVFDDISFSTLLAFISMRDFISLTGMCFGVIVVVIDSFTKSKMDKYY